MEAVSFFERAIELDPNFAMAHARLGTVYSNTGRREAAIRYTKKAFELKDRVSEKERLYIAARYYNSVTGESDKTVETYQVWRQIYPRDWTPYNNLALNYRRLGQLEESLQAAQEALRLESHHPFPYANLAAAYLALNRYEEAQAISKKAVEQKMDSIGNQAIRYQLALMEGDTVSAQRLLQTVKGTPFEALPLAGEAAAAAFSGKLNRALEFSRRSVELSDRYGLAELASGGAAMEALTLALFGKSAEARGSASKVFQSSPPPDAEILAGAALALAGSVAQAESAIERAAKKSPTDTTINRIAIPIAQAAVELARENPNKALELLDRVKPYDFAADANLLPIHLRGQAYLKLGNAPAAAKEFQKILEHRGASPFSPVYPLAHVGLARAQALAGDKAASRKAYQDFFALWKDADPDIPILQQAKTEYAKLN